MFVKKKKEEKELKKRVCHCKKDQEILKLCVSKEQKSLILLIRLLFIAELQRNVRHDIRIDGVPGASMRDQMIMFQDYYDANELFNMLYSSAMFLGGCPGNQDNWFVPPSFLRKYWFLCPSTKPQRLDNSVEIAVYLSQRLQRVLHFRKQMYYEREKYIEHFPSPSVIEEHETTDDMSRRSPSYDDMMIEAASEDLHSDQDSDTEETFFEFSDDLPTSMLFTLLICIIFYEPSLYINFSYVLVSRKLMKLICCYYYHRYDVRGSRVYAKAYVSKYSSFIVIVEGF